MIPRRSGDGSEIVGVMKSDGNGGWRIERASPEEAASGIFYADAAAYRRAQNGGGA